MSRYDSPNESKALLIHRFEGLEVLLQEQVMHNVVTLPDPLQELGVANS